MRPTFTAAACAALVGLLALAHSASAEPKTARQCNSDWAANKTAIQASGKTKRAFVAECRGITVAPRQSPLDKGQYTTEAEAKASCPSDAVEWVKFGIEGLPPERQPQLRQDRNRCIYVRTGVHRCRIPCAQTGEAPCGLILAGAPNTEI